MAAPRMVTQSIPGIALADFAAEVRAGLSNPRQKELPSKYFYDEIGSELFEVICLLPEYGLTRADQRLLERHADEVIDRLPLPMVVAELGSGTGKKTRLILEALSRRQPVTYFPIDISRAALDRCEQDLGRLRAVSVVGFERAYLDGLLEVAARRNPREHLLVLFLGSNIGNFDRPAGVEFLREVRSVLQPGDSLLLSADLEKPVPQLLLAYDDPIGVTAAFNMNLLARINRELEADFDLKRFQHLVRYNEEERRVEMHLLSTENQIVHVRRASCAFSFRKGETIWTENSQKFNRDELIDMAHKTGFRCEAQWIDTQWPFSQNLLTAV